MPILPSFHMRRLHLLVLLRWHLWIAVQCAVHHVFTISAVAAPGEIDGSFVAPIGGFQTVAVQPGDTILAGGTRLRRLLANGALDPLFQAPEYDPTVQFYSIAVRADGTVITGRRNYLSFRRPNGSPIRSIMLSGVPQRNQALAVLPDQSLLVGGEFISIDLQPRPGLAQLLPDGTLDPDFLPSTTGLDWVHTCIPELDGRIVVARKIFDSVNELNEVARLLADGTRDMSFRCVVDQHVLAIALQPDGRFLIGGTFTQVNGVAQAYLARLRADGEIDPTFAPQLTRPVESIALQADGRVVINSTLVTPSGTATGIHWLNPNGSAYPLSLALSPPIKGLALQSDGKLLAVSSDFNATQPGLIRIENDPATASMLLAAGRVHWLRGGSAPEVYDATAEVSSDRGANYGSTVAATRVPGGWEFAGLNVTETDQVRFRGRTVGGYRNGSGGLIEYIAAVGAARPSALLYDGLDAVVGEGEIRAFSDVGVGSSTAHRFTLVNAGSADLILSEVLVGGINAEEFFISSPVSGRLAPGHSSVFHVGFRPLSLGEKSAVLRLIGPGPTEPERTVRLTGRGIVPFASSNADLSSLVLGNGQLSPAFDRTHTAYAASVPHHNAQLELRLSRAHLDSRINITANGIPIQTNPLVYPTVPLNVGINNVIILVTAADGTSKPYSLTIDRAATPAPGGLERVFDLSSVITGSRIPETYAIVPQAGRRVLLGGDYQTSTGQWNLSGLHSLGRDGEADALFHRQANTQVKTVAVAKNGMILAAATHLNSSADLSQQLRRYHPDGRIDPTFSPQVEGAVHAVAFLPDNRILIAGTFVSVDSLPRQYVARLNPDGTADPSFVAPAFQPANSYVGVTTLALEPNAKIIIGGGFSSVGGMPLRCLARLHPDGSLDPTFPTSISSSSSSVRACLRQADGKLIVAGEFSSLSQLNASGTTSVIHRTNLARLLGDGTVDTGYSVAALPQNRMVHSLALDVQNRLLMAGSFESVGDATRYGLARVFPDGTVDPSFTPSVYYTATALALEADGSVLVAANVPGSIAGVPHQGIARLLNDAAIDQLTISDTDAVTWTRGGSAPEVDRVIVETATAPGQDFLEIGTATRTTTGWTFSGTPLPPGGQVRLRGSYQVGASNGSVAWVESLAPVRRPPAPHLAVAQEASALTNGQDLNLPSTEGLPVSLLLSMANVGETGFSSLTATLSGPHASEFAVDGNWPMGLKTGDRVPLRIRFSPAGPGNKSARLTLKQNTIVLFELNLTATSRLSADASLTGLRVDGWPISPAFSSSVATYTSEVASPRESVTVHATASHPHARILINDQELVAPQSQLPVDVIPGANEVTLEVVAPDGVNSRQYTVMVQLGAPRPGDVDSDFAPSLNHPVIRALPLPDGGCLVLENPMAPGVSTIRLSRLLADGSPQPSFQSQEFPGRDVIGLQALAALPSGKFLVTIPTPQPQVVPTVGLARVEADGSLDPTFAAIDGDALPKLEIECLAVGPDGSLLIGGFFAAVFGVQRQLIARLSPSGRLDSTFSPALTSTGSDPPKVTCIAVQADGKILVSGTFTHANGVSRPRFVRFHWNGALDTSFAPGATLPTAYSIQFDSVGHILVARYSGFGPGLDGLTRLTASGQAVPFSSVSQYGSLLPQADRRMLAGPAYFDSRGIQRIDAEGVRDPEFKTTLTPAYGALDAAAYADGSLLIWGVIEKVNDLPRPGLARLLNAPATESLRVPHTGKVRWERTGASPEAHYVTFALSTDGGTTFHDLGLAHRSNGGWEMNGLSLPPSGHIRARARWATGLRNRASSFIESITAFTARPSFLETWRLRHFGPSVDPEWGLYDADPDADGLPNLIECASGLDPLKADAPQAASIVAAEASGFTFRFQRSREALDHGFQWIVEWSDRLTAGPPWSTEGVEVTMIHESGDVQHLLARIPVASGTQRFARVRVIAE